MFSHNTRITKDKKEPSYDASPNAYMMPPCNAITAQQQSQVNSDNDTSKRHSADIPQTKHLASWSLRTRTRYCYKIKEDQWLIDGKDSPNSHDSPFEIHISQSFHVQLRVLLWERSINVLKIKQKSQHQGKVYSWISSIWLMWEQNLVKKSKHQHRQGCEENIVKCLKPIIIISLARKTSLKGEPKLGQRESKILVKEI